MSHLLPIQSQVPFLWNHVSLTGHSTITDITFNSCIHRNELGRHTLNRMNCICTWCGASMWLEEKVSNSGKKNPVFTICCAQGKVQLPPLQQPPEPLFTLLRQN